MTANDLLPGEKGVVSEILASGSIKQRLMDFGLIVGTQVEMVRSAPLDDPVQLRVRDTLLAMRRSEANMLVIDRNGEQHHGGKPHRHRFGRKSK